MKCGVAFFAGMTGMGKTYKALETLKCAIAENGNPALIIDTRRDQLFDGLEHTETVEECLELLYPTEESGLPRRNVCFTPVRLHEDFDALMAAITAKETGGVNVLIDESHLFCDSHYISDEFSNALRLWRQHRFGDNLFLICSQRPSDLHGVGYAACTQGKYIFRPGDKDLEPTAKLFRLEETELRALQERQFIFVP